MQFRKIVVGISGGVDSAVAAYLLKKKGFHVEAAFMQNWDIKDEKGHCTSDADFKDAAHVCQKLGIRLHHVNFVKQYWNEVFTELLDDYQNGLTPNPDILCNRFIKFDHFFKYALENLGADCVATGHYARTSFGPFLEKYNSTERVKLLRAQDLAKDQTFFLSSVKQEPLRKTMFPLGDLLKSKVKKLAGEIGLDFLVAKKESMGICFIGSRNFQDFISEYVENRPGNFVDIDTNKICGNHFGIHRWTLGQRCRIDGTPRRTYAMRKDLATNTIFIVSDHDHPGLHCQLFVTSKPHWISDKPAVENDVLECDFKFQHTEGTTPCKIIEIEGKLLVYLEMSRRAVTPGQYAVFYKNNECLGSGRIVKLGPSKFMLNYCIEDVEELQINQL